MHEIENTAESTQKTADSSSGSNKDTASDRSRAANTDITAADPGNTTETEITIETATKTKANIVKGDREEARDWKSSGNMASDSTGKSSSEIEAERITAETATTIPEH